MSSVLTFLLAVLLPALGAAAETTAPPAIADTNVVSGVRDVRFEATTFLRYSFSWTGDGSQFQPYKYKNSFELWRLYLGFRGRLSDKISFRFTVDARPEAKSTTSESIVGDFHSHQDPNSPRSGVFVKYAWLDFAPFKNLLLRVGVINNPYSDAIDGLWGVRYVYRNYFEERGYYPSADVGARVEWTPANAFVDLGVGVVNGTGYERAVDTDNRKNLWGTVRIRPQFQTKKPGEGLELWLYTNLISGDTETEMMPVISSMVSWKGGPMTIAYQYLVQDLGDRVSSSDEWDYLHSFFATAMPWRYAKVFGRVSTMERPYRDRSSTRNPDLVIGYAIPFSKNFETAISYRSEARHERIGDTRYVYLSALATF